jgi:CDP-paratose 2-epimerase
MPTKKVLITGGAGLVGSACSKLFLQEGWNVICVDNDTRAALFGEDASTFINKQENSYPSPAYTFIDADIGDKEKMSKIIPEADAIIHCAAQPSHPKSFQIPLQDFEINARATVLLLELARTLNPEIPFAFLSTNKVYGDYPNYLKYTVVEKRYEPAGLDSFGEELPLEGFGKTPFGASKTAADIYCREYASSYGLKTAAFRAGCLTGKELRAVQMHGYLPFIIKCALLKEKYTVYGGGYRVRDQIHASDVAKALYFFIQSPKPDSKGLYGKVYNIGGTRKNSISIFETMDAIKAKTGRELDWTEAPARKLDHIWWITNVSKFKRDYPEWKITKDLDYIFNEIIEYYIQKYNLGIQLKARDYFKSKQ